MTQLAKRKWPGLLLARLPVPYRTFLAQKKQKSSDKSAFLRIAKNLLGCVIIAALVCFWLTVPATAFELELGISSGYDDNPRQEEGSGGALFSRTELNLSLTSPQKFIPATTISLFGFAAYQCLSGLDDNWYLGAGLASATSLKKVPGSLSFFGETACYRNPLISDNDYDSLSLGSNFTWFASPQLNITLETGLSWEDYCDDVTSGRHPHLNSNKFRHKTQAYGRPELHISEERNDRLLTTAIKSFYAFSPDFDGTGTIFWRYRHSSVDAECRQAYGLNLDLNWHPIPAIAVDWQLGSEQVPYKYKYQKQSRTENIYNLGIIISWYLHNFTLQTGWDWDKRDSDVNEDNYHRNQWQIQLKYSY